jgi:uncharacterized protein involved in response to NO
MILDLECWLTRVFGGPCPGCGLTRAVTAALHGEILQSVALHPMGLPLIALGSAMVLSRAYRVTTGRSLFPPRSLERAFLGIVVLTIARWAVVSGLG